MTRIDLARVLTILLAAEPIVWRRRVVQGDVAELSDWIARKGRVPAFRWNGDKTENALSMRLHAYAVRLANEDGIPSPENPMIAARSECSTPRHLRPSPTRIVERRRTDEARRRIAAEDADQSFWPEGSA
ncbi:hypothetical protein GCM10011390_19040 [Aureimonas endophytica]|uniref:Uncharacterized protein n=1 Tax=Aureimonas endophytica TaxID=2027858 RepID=A0A917E4M6_9HYPH|nr:hypothetical protein [Aureimonas endophytica]GGE00421.1 hypothetical protein GCM10011390_19040 [Aureimonas endophytica]